jgi:hypothetical protein
MPASALISEPTEGVSAGGSAPIPIPLSDLAEDEPQLSEMAASYRGKEYEEDTTRRVQFQIGASGEGKAESSERDDESPLKDSKEGSPTKYDGADKGKRRRHRYLTQFWSLF